jgi:hypothetical protein
MTRAPRGTSERKVGVQRREVERRSRSGCDEAFARFHILPRAGRQAAKDLDPRPLPHEDVFLLMADWKAMHVEGRPFSSAALIREASAPCRSDPPAIA